MIYKTCGTTIEADDLSAFALAFAAYGQAIAAVDAYRRSPELDALLLAERSGAAALRVIIDQIAAGDLSPTIAPEGEV